MKRGFLLRHLAAVSVAVVAVGFSSPPVAAAGNVGLHLHKTVDPAQLTINPNIGVALAVDKTSAIPADKLTYTAVVTNPTVTFAMGGDINAEATADADATVAYYWDELEVCALDCGNGMGNPNWTAVATFEAAQSGYQPVTPPKVHTGMSFAAQPVTRPGVVYPTAGDPILGTAISRAATAGWTYLARITLAPAQIATLSDPSQALAVRNVLHMEVTIRNASAAQPYTDPELFTNPFTSAPNPGAISNVTVTFTLPDGTSTKVPATSSLAPGGSAKATVTYKVPVPAARGAGETEAAYIARLHSLDGSALTATAVAAGSGFSGTVYATSSPVTTNEFVPIVLIAKSGPSSIVAGDTETNPLALRNVGGAAASSLVITDTVPSSPNGSVSGTPASLAPNATGSATATYPVPVSQAEGSLTDTASVSWQDANGNSYGPLSSSFTTTVHNVLFGADLSLAPVTAGPNPTGSTQTLTATLIDRHSNPIPNQVITFTITGANPGTGTATTGASGKAVFTYTGNNAGNDTAIATVVTPFITLTSNTASISWGKPLQPVVTTQVQGNFFPNPNNTCQFSASGTPAFSQSFPDILFNADPSVIPHDISSVNPATRPFTDKTVDVNGNYNGQIVAQGNGFQAGATNTPLFNFFAALTGSFIVNQAGDVTFTIIHDDGYILGVGNGATRVNGDLEGNVPATTAFNGYGVVAAFNQAGSATGSATVHFPAPGTYPYEIDYTECGGGGLQLVLETAKFIAQTDPLSIYVGYADGLRAGGSIFPFPWQGSPGVTFIGGCTFDAGAIRFDNSGNTDITLDHVTVDLGTGGPHFDLWPVNLVVPAHGILILTQTGCFNFDTSDFSNAGCGGNNNVLPLVNVTRGGVLKTFTDTGQVLNTHGFDSVCQGNESIPWQRIAGQANTVNVPLPPAVMLDLMPFNIPNAVQGQTVSVTVSALDGAGNPQVNLPVTLQAFGANPQNLTANTNTSGLAAFSYPGNLAGTDTLQASAFISGQRALSNQGTVVWSPPGGTSNPLGATITGVTPADGTVVTKPIAITASITPPAGQSITSWQATYRLEPGGSSVTLASGAGIPPTQLVTLDPTTLVDGTYAINISAATSNGATQTLSTTVTVIGNLKPGRYVTSYLDMSVPVAGFPMQVVRTYDSTDKSSGDFGTGWKVSLVNFRVSPNRNLGAGGWTQYNKSCVLGLCFTAFRNSTPRYVTVTFPDQHTEVFDFTPQGGTNLFWECSPQFTARAATGTTSTLAAPDDTACSYLGDGNIYGTSGLYSPHRFRLTTKDGRVLLLDALSGLVSETDTFGNALTVSASGVTSTLGPATNPTPGPSITFTRDGQGRITDLNGPLAGQHVHYTFYSTVNELQTDTDPNGNIDTYSYDPTTGNLASVTGPAGAALTALTYDASGRLTSISVNGEPAVAIAIDPGLHSEAFTDPNGKLTTVLTYDDLGDMVQKDEIVNGQTHLTSHYQYDSVGRLTDSVDPAGNETKLTYDGGGNIVSASQANLNRSWTYQNFNALGEPGQISQPDGTALLTLTYDPNTGAVQDAQAPGQSPSMFAYFPNGRLKQVVDPAGRQINYTYDAAGHLASVGDGTNPSTVVSIDAGGLLRSVADALGHQIRYDYWPAGQLKTITDGRNNTWQYFYDGLGRLDHTIDPVQATTQYHYNAFGQLDQVTDRNHAVTTYAHDVDGNLIRISRPGNDVINYTYDARGLLTEADNSLSHVDRVYDAADRLQSETTCANTGSSTTPCPAPGSLGGALPAVRLSYQYWPDGQVKQVTSSDTGVSVNYTYDSNGRPQTISDPANPAATYAYTYDALGRVSTLRLPNGILNSFSYNLSGDLTAVDAALNGTKLANFDYQVDPVTGRWTQMTDPLGVHSFSYFANGALKSESHPASSGLSDQSYSYDASSNRSTGGVVSQFDAANRLTTDGTFNYTFDAEGNQTGKTPIAGGSGFRYAWNSDHQLTAITYPNGNSSTYQYDPFGRRVKSQDPSGTTAYVYDGSDVHADYNGQGQLQTSYLPQMESVSGATPSYYIADGLGTVRSATNGSGAITASSSYTAWGIPAAGNSTGNRYTFTGYQFDPASGLYFAGSRYYDPTNGRFLSEDPQPSLNAYPYAANNPIGNVDVRGEGLVDYAQSLLNAYGNAECVAGVASAIATSAYSATMSALAGAQVNANDALTAIGVGVGLAVGGCATNIPSKGGNVQANRLVGLALERKVRSELERAGFTLLYKDPKWVWTGLGPRVIDILAVRYGHVVAFEIKSGGSRYLSSQIAKDAWMARFGAVIDGVQYPPFATILIRG